ncbi:TPA: hypothetical protein HA234_02545, partial [Candidatus Woesearchaeota archaeon]|nr:hypothetical protein [Candidatus Woesearchaeota archaeon]
MGIFSKILYVYQKNKPHRTLLKEYTKIQQLAAGIQEELKALRKIQKEMVEENLFFNVALFRRAG